MRVLFLLGALLAYQLNTIAETPPSLFEAISAYDNSLFEKSAKLLINLLYPMKLKEKGDIQKARLYLGANHFILGEKSNAKKEFINLLEVEPNTILDPMQFNPELIAFFEDLKKEFQLYGRIDDSSKEKQVPFYLHFLPFGVSHFYKGQFGWGSLFFATQFLALDVMIGQPLIGSRSSKDTIITPREKGIASFVLFESYQWSLYSSMSSLQESKKLKSIYKFIPFGTGQFVNEQYLLGAVVLLIESLLLDQVVQQKSGFLSPWVSVSLLGVSMFTSVWLSLDSNNTHETKTSNTYIQPYIAQHKAQFEGGFILRKQF